MSPGIEETWAQLMALEAWKRAPPSKRAAVLAYRFLLQFPDIHTGHAGALRVLRETGDFREMARKYRQKVLEELMRAGYSRDKAREEADALSEHLRRQLESYFHYIYLPAELHRGNPLLSSREEIRAHAKRMADFLLKYMPALERFERIADELEKHALLGNRDGAIRTIKSAEHAFREVSAELSRQGLPLFPLVAHVRNLLYASVRDLPELRTHVESLYGRLLSHALQRD